MSGALNAAGLCHADRMKRVHADQRFTPEKRETFLAELRKIPNVVRAARIVGLYKCSVYAIYRAEPDFAKRWDEAIAEGVEALEAEILRRGFEGYEGRPVVHQGVVVREVREYSDQLAMFALKKYHPDYREMSRFIAPGEAPTPTDLSAAAVKLAGILANAQARKDGTEFDDLLG